MIVQIKPAGQAIPKVDKYATESIVYTLDCTAILLPNEIITKASVINKEDGCRFSDVRTRRGVNIEVRIDNDPLTTSQYVDCQVQVEFETIFKNKKIAVFQVRVHK